ncbi:DUF5074 domain-containing protein [Parabacteroides sp.]
MKKKSILLVSVLCALMSFVFTGCKDDDENQPTVPTEVVTGVTFTDTDQVEGAIKGTLKWTAPGDVSNITKYVIYLSADGKGRDTKLGEVEVGTNSYAIETSITADTYIIVVACNAQGESDALASVKIQDLTPESPGPEPEPTDNGGIYFLNSGKIGSNNAGLSCFNLNTLTMTVDTFMNVNERGLGDTANDMIVYGSKMYIAVYGSNIIEVTDLSGKSIKQIKSDGDALLPRFFTANEGKVYVSLYDGYVARLDTASLEIEQKVKVGRNPEQLVVANNKLYVANSGGLDHSTPLGYDKTVSVVDLASFQETKKVEVVINPTNLVTDSQGDVYLVSTGDYGAIPNTFQRIDSKTDEVTIITETNATEMASTGDKLYMIYSQYDANWNQVISFISYDAINEKVISDNFITDGTSIAKPYKIGADPKTGYIYITASDYKTNGDVYAFDASGKKVFQFEVGLNPVKAVYVKR